MNLNNRAQPGNPQKSIFLKQKINTEKYYPQIMDFTYLECQGIKIVSQIGRGGFGVVYKGIYQKKYVAVKINFQTISLKNQVMQMGMLKLTQGLENIGQLIKILPHCGKIHIISEFFDHQLFISYLKTITPLDIKYYMFTLLKGLKQLKQLGIIHRDIKPANFLYNVQTKKGKIIDFGVATLAEQFIKQKFTTMKQNCKNYKIYQQLIKCQETQGCKLGTNVYSSLEVLMKDKQSYSLDIWSAGIIFLQLLIRKYTIFKDFLMKQNLRSNRSYICSFLMQLGQIYGQQVYQICQRYHYKLQLPFKTKIVRFDQLIKCQENGKQCIDLLGRMLKLKPQQRISVEQALSHQYFKSIRQ